MTEKDDVGLRVLIEHVSGYRLDREERLVADYIKSHGDAYDIAPLSFFKKGKIDVSKFNLVVGTLSFMKLALKQLQIELPAIDSYPSELSCFFHRKIWQSNLERVLYDFVLNGCAVFIKPALRTKRFTGFVLNNEDDWRIQGVSKHELVWCSEPVTWVSEWRVYVVKGNIAFVAHYEGDKAHTVDIAIVRAAIQKIKSPRSYAIDFGVLADGATALIEMNDGFSIGAYGGIDGKTYYEMLQDRWDEIIVCANTKQA